MNELHAALAKRGRVWGDENAERVREMRIECKSAPNLHLAALPSPQGDADAEMWDYVSNIIQSRVSQNRLVLIK